MLSITSYLALALAGCVAALPTETASANEGYTINVGGLTVTGQATEGTELSDLTKRAGAPFVQAGAEWALVAGMTRKNGWGPLVSTWTPVSSRWQNCFDVGNSNPPPEGIQVIGWGCYVSTWSDRACSQGEFFIQDQQRHDLPYRSVSVVCP